MNLAFGNIFQLKLINEKLKNVNFICTLATEKRKREFM